MNLNELKQFAAQGKLTCKRDYIFTFKGYFDFNIKKMLFTQHYTNRVIENPEGINKELLALILFPYHEMNIDAFLKYRNESLIYLQENRPKAYTFIDEYYATIFHGPISVRRKKIKNRNWFIKRWVLEENMPIDYINFIYGFFPNEIQETITVRTKTPESFAVFEKQVKKCLKRGKLNKIPEFITTNYCNEPRFASLFQKSYFNSLKNKNQDEFKKWLMQVLNDSSVMYLKPKYTTLEEEVVSPTLGKTYWYQLISGLYNPQKPLSEEYLLTMVEYMQHYCPAYIMSVNGYNKSKEITNNLSEYLGDK